MGSPHDAWLPNEREECPQAPEILGNIYKKMKSDPQTEQQFMTFMGGSVNMHCKLYFSGTV